MKHTTQIKSSANQKLGHFTSLTILLLIIPVFICLTTALSAQEKKNSISANGSLTHYIGIDDFKTDSYEGYYKFPLSPGVELTYSRQIFPRIELSTGINFQRVHVASNVHISYDYLLRFRYNELSIPLLLKISFPLKMQNKWYFTAGDYFGRQAGVIAEVPYSVGWVSWEDKNTIAGYSSDHNFNDLYFDAGYSKWHSWGDIEVAGFFKYRVNTTWLNTYQKKPQLGIKLIYSFKF